MEAMQFPFFSPGYHPGLEQPEHREQRPRRSSNRTGQRALDKALISAFDGPGVSLATGLFLSGVVSAGLWVGLGWAVWSFAS